MGKKKRLSKNRNINHTNAHTQRNSLIHNFHADETYSSFAVKVRVISFLSLFCSLSLSVNEKLNLENVTNGGEEKNEDDEETTWKWSGWQNKNQWISFVQWATRKKPTTATSIFFLSRSLSQSLLQSEMCLHKYEQKKETQLKSSVKYRRRCSSLSSLNAWFRLLHFNLLTIWKNFLLWFMNRIFFSLCDAAAFSHWFSFFAFSAACHCVRT